MCYNRSKDTGYTLTKSVGSSRTLSFQIHIYVDVKGGEWSMKPSANSPLDVKMNSVNENVGSN